NTPDRIRSRHHGPNRDDVRAARRERASAPAADSVAPGGLWKSDTALAAGSVPSTSGALDGPTGSAGPDVHGPLVISTPTRPAKKASTVRAPSVFATATLVHRGIGHPDTAAGDCSELVTGRGRGGSSRSDTA